MARNTDIQKFWKELNRRKTIRVITVYSATSFIILQLIDLIAGPLHLPEWTLTFTIVLLAAGFIVTSVLSWVYDITPAGIEKTKPADKVTTEKVPAKPARSTYWKLVSFISVAVIAAMIILNLTGKNPGIAVDPEKSLAVLPFRNDSPDDTNTYFINGVMEEVLNHLQVVSDLRVISRTSVEQYRNTTKSIPEIAKEQGVNYIVEGSGQKYGSSFRISVQLIRAENENHIWGRSYSSRIRIPGDIMEVQSSIAKEIVGELEASLTPEEEQIIEKIPTKDLTAYDFYQRGRDELLKFWIDDDNKSALANAEKLFRKALKFDPGFADANVGLAGVYWYKSYSTDYLNKNYLDSVLILANIALGYDDKLSEGYFIRGCYHGVKGQTDRSLEDLNKAIKLNPNGWMAYYGKAMIYDFEDPVICLENLTKAASINHDIVLPTIFRNIGGKFLVTGYIEQAKHYFFKAFEIDKDSAVYFSCLGGTEENQGNYQAALEFYKRAYLIKPTYTDVINSLGQDYQFNRQFEESLENYKELISVKRNLGLNLREEMFRIGYAYMKNGSPEEADFYFNKHLEYCSNVLKSSRPYSQVFMRYYEIAGIYAARGEKDKAYQNLEIYNKFPGCELWMLTAIRNDPMFDSLREESEFLQIIKNMESKYMVVHAEVGRWIERNGNAIL